MQGPRKKRGIWGKCTYESLAVFGSCQSWQTLEFKSFHIKATERLWAVFDCRAFDHGSSFLNLMVKIFKYDHSNASYWAVLPAILRAYYAVQMDSNFEFCTRDPHLNYAFLRRNVSLYENFTRDFASNFFSILHIFHYWHSWQNLFPFLPGFVTSELVTN